MTTISVIGLGKLGACMAAVFAAKGFKVIGADVNRATVEAVNAGKAPVLEPQLGEWMQRGKSRLEATTDVASAVAASDVTFFIVPTPSDPDGRFSLRFVLEAARSAGEGLRRKNGYHLFVLSSTVLPGATSGELREALERASGRTCGDQFGLCYSPEFIALGSVIRDFTNPDFLLVGAFDDKSAETLSRIYDRTMDNNPPTARMSPVNAEIVKIALNSYVTMKITFANLVAEVCDATPGANVDVVTEALGRDTRIGAKYLRGGLGFGGPCFPRDNAAFAAFMSGLGVDPRVPNAVDESNRRPSARAAARAIGLLPPGGGRIAVLGLAYKANTPVLDASQGMLIVKELVAAGRRVVVFDPMAGEAARSILGGTVEFAKTARDAVAASAVVVVATAWKEFQELGPSDWGGRPVLDCWRALSPERVPGLVRLGVGPSAQRAPPIPSPRAPPPRKAARRD